MDITYQSDALDGMLGIFQTFESYDIQHIRGVPLVYGATDVSRVNRAQFGRAFDAVGFQAGPRQAGLRQSTQGP